MPSATQPPAPLRPAGLLTVVAVVALQAAALAGGAVMQVYGLVTGQVASVPASLFLVLVFGGGALWLGKAAAGLWNGRRWPRAAALTAQLFTVVVALSMVRPANGTAALLLVLAAVLAGLTLFRPGVVDWTTQDVAPERR